MAALVLFTVAPGSHARSVRRKAWMRRGRRRGVRQPSCTARHASRVEAPDGRVHRLRRPSRIEVLAQERDLAASGAQEHDVLLAVGPPGRPDLSLALDLGDGGVRVGARLDPHIEEAEVLDGTDEPRREPRYLGPSLHAGW